jgi:hypothetical protein
VELLSPQCCSEGVGLLVFGSFGSALCADQPSICFLHMMCDRLPLKIRIMSP